MRPGPLLTRVLALSALLGLAVAPAVPAAAQTSSGMGTVVVVHALEGVSADVYLDGSNAPALQNFDFRRITDPLAMPVGKHRADIRKAGDPPTAPPAMSGEFTVDADQRITVAAILKPDGTPSWLAFPNDVFSTDASSAGFRFRHLAAAAPVKLVLDGTTLPTTYTNLGVAAGQPAPITTTPGAHTLAVNDAATGAAVVPAQSFDLAAGALANVYLTGKASPKTLALLAQTPTGSTASDTAGLQATPQIIATGDSGLADPSFMRGTVTSTPFLFGLAVALACGVLGVGARRRGARVHSR